MNIINEIKKIPILQKIFSNKSVIKIIKFTGKYITPLFAVLLAALFKATIDQYIINNSLIYFTIIIIFYSWIGGLVSGLLTTLFSSIIIFYFFSLPEHSFNKVPGESVRLFFYILQSLIIALVVGKLNQSRLQMKKVKETIDEERQKIQEIIDALYTFVVVITPDGKVIEANKATLDLDTSKKNIVGKNITEIYPWSYSEHIKQTLRRSIVEVLIGSKVAYDEKMRVSDNKVIDVYVTMTPTYNKRNKAENIIVTATDITERKAYELELEKMHKNYLKLINSNIIGMVIVDRNGNMQEYNDAFLKMIKYSKRELELEELRLQNITITDSGSTYESIIETTITKSYAGPLEIEFVDRDHNKIPSIISSVLINEEEGLMLLVILDITERKQLEQKKDEFLSIASHELKTPLTTLKGYVQLLGSKLHDRQQENELFVSRMDNQLVKITDLINDLLDISRIQSGNLNLTESEFDLVVLAEEIIQEITPLTDKHRLNLFKPNKPQIIRGDRARIGQVMVNLLSNSVKYSPNSENINIYIQDRNEQVRLMIEDFGIGIPSDKIEKLFQKFYRVEESQSNWHQGLGLGLYISNEIIKRHRSSINIKSEVGKGSVFYFDLIKSKL